MIKFNKKIKPGPTLREKFEAVVQSLDLDPTTT